MGSVYDAAYGAEFKYGKYAWENTKQFALDSGIPLNKFRGTLNSPSSIDRADGPQQFANLVMEYFFSNNLKQKVSIRVGIVRDFVARAYKLGVFHEKNIPRLIHVVSKIHKFDEGIFVDIHEDLGEAIKREDISSKIRMAYAYARRVAASGLYLQGIFKYDQLEYVNNIFKGFQFCTGHTVDFQEESYDQAIELLSSYDSRFDRLVAAFITKMAKEYLSKQVNLQFVEYEKIMNYCFSCCQ